MYEMCVCVCVCVCAGMCLSVCASVVCVCGERERERERERKSMRVPDQVGAHSITARERRGHALGVWGWEWKQVLQMSMAPPA